MHYSQSRSRILTSNERRINHVSSSKDLEDNEICNPSFTSSYNVGEHPLNSRITKKNCANISSSSYKIRRKDSTVFSDVRISELNTEAIDADETLNPRIRSQSECQNLGGSTETGISGSKKKSADRDNRRFNSQDVCMPSWAVRSVPQKGVNSHEVTNRALLSDQCRGHHFPSDHLSNKFLRKGSSSKAPHIDDVSAPLYVEKNYRQSNKNLIYQNEITEQPSHEKMLHFPKNHNITNVSKQIGQSSFSLSDGCDQRGKKKITINLHKVRSADSGQRNRDSNPVYISRGGLSNLVCSSASDVLPSLSSSTLNSIACSSRSDVFASSTSLTSDIIDHRTLRKSSKTFGHGSRGETPRDVYLGKEHVKNGIRYDVEDQNSNFENDTPQEETLSSTELEYSPLLSVTPLLQKDTRYNRTTASVEQGNETRTSASASPSVKNRSVPTANYRRGRGPRSFKSNDDGPYSHNPFLVSIPPFGDELSTNQQDLRRSLYTNQMEVSRSGSRVPNRRTPISSSSSLSGTREMRYMRSSISGPPPARPPPTLPLSPFEMFSVSSSAVHMPVSTLTSDSYFSHMVRLSSSTRSHQSARQGSSDLETVAFGSSMSRGEVQSRLAAERLSEQILMLEASLLLGGIGLYDNYRDMRIDIDNMSYEELLALEERIGNVNTGLNEESIAKCMRITSYVAPDKNITCALQDTEIKCSICQEEFVEACELGVLECGHNHHMDCIKQWLSQKNECPICKAAAMK